jgi:hypothetical protein
MPFEDGADSNSIFIEQLSVVEGLITDNSDCHIVVGGDFNVDFTRDKLHTAILSSFCDESDLIPAIRHVNCTMDYSYQFNMLRFSTIDHFLLSGSIFHNAVDKLQVLHDIDNLSDHDPIVLGLTLKVGFFQSCDIVRAPRPSWVKATDSDMTNYRSAVSSCLRSTSLPVNTLLCTNLLCKDITHLQAINTFAQNLTDSLVSAASATIPSTCNRSASRRIPGWTIHVLPLRDRSIFWHRIWVDCGRPKSGAVAESMRRSRAAYHYAVRRIKNDEEAIVRERIASTIVNDDCRNFWTEIKRIRCNKAGTSRVVDG